VEQYDNIVELVDEQGESIQFEYLMNLDYGGREYILLRPLEQEDGQEDEVVILRVEEDENGDDVYTSIEDEKEANEILEAFNVIIDEYEL